MMKVLITLVVIVCVTIIGCQPPGTNQADLNELKKELKQTQEYISVLKAHYDGIIDKEYGLIKLETDKTEKEMEDIWAKIKDDSIPEPKPPPPPWETKADIR